MKRKIVVGNWKMNPTNLAEAQNIYKKVKRTALGLTSTSVVVCPPSVYISKFISSQSKAIIKPLIAIGAQNVSSETQGAFTGEISPGMLKDLGVTHSIVGHSERRVGGAVGAGETDEVVAKKVLAILDAGIHPIICVGESVRDTQGLYLETLKNQIKNSLAFVPKKLASQLIVAYEPLWAIGAKDAMEPATIEEATIFVRKVLADIFGQENTQHTLVLYGGSINFRNAPDIIARGKVDGLLVGRESVNTPGFIELLKAVDAVK